MQLILKKRPKNAIIVQGFPGIGLVGTIAVEFLLEHLKTEQIGKISVPDMPPAIAIHQGKVVDPFGIYYNKEYNVVLLHAIVPTNGFEWHLSESIVELAKKLEAKEIVSMEGVGGEEGGNKVLFYSSKSREKLKKSGVEALDEGIIMGVTGALLMNAPNIPITCFFSETHSNMPDSKAAAGIIEALDKYLGLKVDYHPLLKQAENFEEKLQGLMKKGQAAADLTEKKRMSYVG